MNTLVLNSGSSSVKCQLWRNGQKIATASVDRVLTGAEAGLSYKSEGIKIDESIEACDHRKAIFHILDILKEKNGLAVCDVVCHRIVQGGEVFSRSVFIDEEAYKNIKSLTPLAPLHQPANLAGIDTAMEAFPDAQQVAVFDTSFHASIPPRNYLYALPMGCYEDHGVRRYGFHGTSYVYVTRRISAILNKELSSLNIIVAHIGNGASMCAVKGGRSFDTSMGFTPLQGLVMGTRSGDLDPAIVPFLMKQMGLTPDEMTDYLNKKCGLAALSGVGSDFREIESEYEKGNEGCILTVDIHTARMRKYFGAYAAQLGRVDAIVFTAGIGEHTPLVREKSLDGLSIIGAEVDKEKNNSAPFGEEVLISSPSSKIPIYVIPTDEERVMVEDGELLAKGEYKGPYETAYSFGK